MKARAISEKQELVDVIQHCQYCHLSMVDAEGNPYVIPMNFGFKDDVVYLHGAQHGKKIEILKKHPAVCINFTTDHLLRYQNEAFGKLRWRNLKEEHMGIEHRDTGHGTHEISKSVQLQFLRV